MRLFVSHFAKGLTEEEVKELREKAVEYAKTHLSLKECEEIELVESLVNTSAYDISLVKYLDKTMDILSTIDACLMIGNWKEYVSCQIEHDYCAKNCIPIVHFA